MIEHHNDGILQQHSPSNLRTCQQAAHVSINHILTDNLSPIWSIRQVLSLETAGSRLK